MTNIARAILEQHNDFAHAEHLVQVEGLSSPKVCNLLNQLVGALEDGEHYLEIGTWKGLTLCSAMYANPGKVCYACDKFRLWGRHTGWGFQARRALHANVGRYRPDGATVHFFDMESDKLFPQSLVPGRVKVYFFDGDHSYEGTRKAVVQAAPLLTQDAILLMDDFRGPEIPDATYQGIQDAGLEILWERNLTREQGWWNGLGVFHLHKPA